MIFDTKVIQAALFDMDGTMFDTERLRFRMLKNASEKIWGEAIRDEVLMGSLGLSAKSAEELAKKTYGDDYPYREIRQEADRLELAYVETHGVPVKEGLFDVLERLKKNGVLLAVATSSRRAIAEEYLLGAGVLSYFDRIVCGDDVEHGKPNPEIFLKAAQALNCDPRGCLVFEDSENGLLAASRAGALPVFIKDIKEPRSQIRALVFRAYESMTDLTNDLALCTKKYPVPKISEAFPKRLNSVRVGIHGFGAIGGGYLAQVFSYWDGYTRPAEIIGSTRSAFTREIVNSFGKYMVHYGSIAMDQTIDHVRLIDQNDEAEMKAMYESCDIIGLTLPETAIRHEAEMIAKGLAARFGETDRELTLLVVLNKIGGGKYVKNHVRLALQKIAGADGTARILEKTHFCESVVNRIVSKVPLAMQMKQVQMGLRALRLTGGDEQPCTDIPGGLQAADDSKHTVLSISKSLRSLSQAAREFSDVNITLFDSGPCMPLYVGHGGTLLTRLRQIEVMDNIKKMQELKNKLSNGPHAIAAWYASLLGYQTIGQGMGDARVRTLVEKLMRDEVKPAMLAIMPEASDYINNFIDTFIRRCRSSFHDPCTRIGRDPLRKLQRHERVFGTAFLAGVQKVETPLLAFGAALGLLYAIAAKDPKDQESTVIRRLFEERHRIRDVLLYRGLYNGKPYDGLDEKEDAAMIAQIEAKFERLKEELTPGLDGDTAYVRRREGA